MINGRSDFLDIQMGLVNGLRAAGRVRQMYSKPCTRKTRFENCSLMWLRNLSHKQKEFLKITKAM